MKLRTVVSVPTLMVGIGFLASFASDARAQFSMPTWHDIERAVRPQDLPLHFRTPEETQTVIDDPPSEYSAYRIGFRNRTGSQLRMEVHAFMNGKWVTTPDKFWTIAPGAETWMLYHDKQAVLGTLFRFQATSTDGSNRQWGDLGRVLSPGQPYQSNGGTRIFYETLTP